MRDPNWSDCRSLKFSGPERSHHKHGLAAAVFCVLRRGLGEAYRPGVSLQAWQGGGWAVSWVLNLEIGEKLQQVTGDHHSRGSMVASDLCSWSSLLFEVGGGGGTVIGRG